MSVAQCFSPTPAGGWASSLSGASVAGPRELLVDAPTESRRRLSCALRDSSEDDQGVVRRRLGENERAAGAHAQESTRLFFYGPEEKRRARAPFGDGHRKPHLFDEIMHLPIVTALPSAGCERVLYSCEAAVVVMRRNRQWEAERTVTAESVRSRSASAPHSECGWAMSKARGRGTFRTTSTAGQRPAEKRRRFGERDSRRSNREG